MKRTSNLRGQARPSCVHTVCSAWRPAKAVQCTGHKRRPLLWKQEAEKGASDSSCKGGSRLRPTGTNCEFELNLNSGAHHTCHLGCHRRGIHSPRPCFRSRRLQATQHRHAERPKLRSSGRDWHLPKTLVNDKSTSGAPSRLLECSLHYADVHNTVTLTRCASHRVQAVLEQGCGSQIMLQSSWR